VGEVVGADHQQRDIGAGSAAHLRGEVEGGGAGDRHHLQLDGLAGLFQRAGQPGTERVLGAVGAGAEGEGVTEDEEAERHTGCNGAGPSAVP
jgi:hypothetical protein